MHVSRILVLEAIRENPQIVMEAAQLFEEQQVAALATAQRDVLICSRCFCMAPTLSPVSDSCRRFHIITGTADCFGYGLLAQEAFHLHSEYQDHRKPLRLDRSP